MEIFKCIDGKRQGKHTGRHQDKKCDLEVGSTRGELDPLEFTLDIHHLIKMKGVLNDKRNHVYDFYGLYYSWHHSCCLY